MLVGTLRTSSWRWIALLVALACLLVVAPAAAQLIPPGQPPRGAGLDEGSPNLPKVNVPPPKKETPKPEAPARPRNVLR